MQAFVHTRIVSGIIPHLGLILLLITLTSCQPDQRKVNTIDSPTQDQALSSFVADGALYIIKEQEDTIAELSVEVAEDEFKQEQGLMHRHYLPDSAGMFFIFPQEMYRSFWMKNTPLSLDILYIDREGIIRTIHRNTIPYSEGSLLSDTPAQYVLEVNAGYCDIHGITEGMQVAFVRSE